MASLSLTDAAATVSGLAAAQGGSVTVVGGTSSTLVTPVERLLYSAVSLVLPESVVPRP